MSRAERHEAQRRARLQAQIGDGYRLGKLLGSGGMGEVWAGHDFRLDCPVAIKILSSELSANTEFRERFRREAKTPAKFSHARIVHVLAVDELARDGRLFMVMELVEGRTLRAILDELAKQGRVLDHVRAVLHVIQILDGLGTAHAMGIIHRDVKPENVIVSDGERVKLLDFGVAMVGEGTGPRRAGPVAEWPRLGAKTKKSVLMGTPRYMAPELIRDRKCDARSDLYALGIILLLLLTGVYPYEVDPSDELSVLRAHVEQEPTLRRDKNPGCPPELWAIVERLLAKDPEDRFQDADELDEALFTFVRLTAPPAVAEVVAEERRERAIRRTYAELGRRTVAPAEPRGGSQGVVGDFVATPPSADVTGPAPTVAPRMVEPYPLARPGRAGRAGEVIEIAHLRARPEYAVPAEVIRPAAVGSAVRMLPRSRRMELPVVQASLMVQAAPVVQVAPVALVKLGVSHARALAVGMVLGWVTLVLGVVVWKAAEKPAGAMVTAVPSAMVTAVPSAMVTAVPSAMVTAVPSATVTAVPSATVTVAPSATAMAAPSARAPSVKAPKRPALGAVPAADKPKRPPLPFPPL